MLEVRESVWFCWWVNIFALGNKCDCGVFYTMVGFFLKNYSPIGDHCPTDNHCINDITIPMCNVISDLAK
jgi:hypothetical protein